MVDQQRLQQILSNLLSNASKYSHPYGDIELHLIKEKNHLRIEVRDFGEVISDEYKERVFQKFSQEDGSNTRQKGGTGLGLSICKEMVEHMHGQIGFHSKQAEGSTFFFTVPLASSVLGA
jgi:signal transduction histidine kinase